MTHIYLVNDKQIRCEGHAQYDIAGHDIVCAAISALAQSYAFYMQDLEDRGMAKVERLWIGEGMMDIIVDSQCLESKVAYEIIKNGLYAIADSYPDNLSIEEGTEKRT